MSTSLPPATIAEEPRVSAMMRARSLWQSAGMLALYILIFISCSVLFRPFLSWYNMASLAQLITTVGIVACGMLFCLTSGDFDLSVGSVAALSGIVAVLVTNSTKSVALGMACGIATGTFVGFINGVVIAVLGINALIATLATMQIVRGLAYMTSKNTSIGVTSTFFHHLFGTYTIFSVPTPVWVMFGAFVVCGFLLHKTTFGRNTLAIGGNKEAARLAGINTTRTKILIFMLQGALAALAGVVESSQVSLGNPNGSVGLELRVISACVLGGVSLTGGVGTILAVIVGTLIMGTVQNAMDLNGINTNYQYIVSGGILLAAVMFDQLKRRWS